MNCISCDGSSWCGSSACNGSFTPHTSRSTSVILSGKARVDARAPKVRLVRRQISHVFAVFMCKIPVGLVITKKSKKKPTCPRTVLFMSGFIFVLPSSFALRVPA